MKQTLNEEQYDYLREMMNVGAGNAAGALSQLLKHNVEVTIPDLLLVPLNDVTGKIVDDPSTPIVCIPMDFSGDITGQIFFIMPEKDAETFTDILFLKAPPGVERGEKIDMEAIAEIGNIVTGVYLDALESFSKLSIIHSAPKISFDMAQALLDESLIVAKGEQDEILVVINTFYTKNGEFRVFLLIVPQFKIINILCDSISMASPGHD